MQVQQKAVKITTQILNMFFCVPNIDAEDLNKLKLKTLRDIHIRIVGLNRPLGRTG